MSFAAVVERLQAIVNPYPGLRPFETDESHLFFGRDQQVAELVGRLERNRFLAVLGVSGSGKSSLVRAGLIPALERGQALEAGRKWRVVVTRPAGAPFESLASELRKIGLDTSRLKNSSHGLIDIAQQLPPDDGLLVVVDQLEELFRYKDAQPLTEHARRGRDLSASEAAEFVQLLLAASRHQPPVYIVLTMRSDYLGDCAEFRDLPETLNDCQYLVPRMTREQRKEAIEGPLGRVAIAPALVQRLLNDAGDEPDQLPVLQHALMRTWDHWRHTDPERHRHIELLDYVAIGGFDNAIDQHAEELLAGAPKEIAEVVFKRLTARGRGNRERRDPATLAELWAVCQADTPDAQNQVTTVVDRFRLGAATFLSPRAGAIGAEAYIDITHESLIRQWRRLREDWLPAEQRSAKTFLELAEKARNWEAGKAEALVGLDLNDALEWDRQRNRAPAWGEHYAEAADLGRVSRLIEASRKHERAQRLRRRGLWIAIPLAAVFALLSIIAWMQTDAAKRARAGAEEARKSAEEARTHAVKAANEATSQGREALEARNFADKLREEAEHLGTVSLARQLAARSQLIQTEQVDLEPSVLLAVEALRRAPSPDNERALRQSVARLPRQMAALPAKGGARLLAVSTDGRTVATVSGDDTVRIFDARTWQEISGMRPGPGSRVLALAVGVGGTWVAATTDGNTARLVEAPDGREIRRFSTREPANIVAMSRDGRYIVIVSGNIVRIFDGTDGRELALLPATNNVQVAAVSPDGRWVALGANDPHLKDYKVRVFDRASGKESPSHSLLGTIRSLAFSADGRWLAAGSDEGTARVFDVATGAEGARLIHGKPVTSVAFSDDARWVATGSEDGAARVFDPSRGTEVSRLVHHCKDPAKCAVRAVAFSRDGRWVVSGGDAESARVFETVSANDVSRVAEEYPVRSMAFAADGQRLITGSGHIEAALVRVFDAPSWNEVVPINPPNPEVNSVAVSENGRLVAIASNWGGGPWVYNVERPEKPVSALGGRSLMKSVALSGDGRWVVFVTGNQAQVFEVATGKQLALPGTKAVYAVALSVDGRSVAIGAGEIVEGGTAHLFELPGGKALWQFAQREPVLAVALSSDGRWLATASGPPRGTIRLLDATTKKERWSRANDSSTLLGFSPDGQTFAIASDDALRLFETASGKEISRILPGHRVGAIGFAEQGRYLMAASVATSIYSTPDVIVTRYLLRQNELIQDACSRVTRDLTNSENSEWKEYVGAEVPYRKTCNKR